MIELNHNEKQAFQKIGHGCLATYTSMDETNWQTDLQVHLPTSEIKSREMKTAKVETSIALHETNGFPLIRMAVTIYSIPGDPAKMECFFNLVRQDHVKLVSSLAQQQKINLHLFDDNLKYSHTKQVDWYLQQEVTDIMIKSAPMVNEKTDADFERARAKFMEENEL